MRVCRCSMANVVINFYVIFREALSKWACKFINYISFVQENSGEVCVIFNYEVWRFKFSVIDNVFFFFNFFCGGCLGCSVGLMCLCIMLVISCSSSF